MWALRRASIHLKNLRLSSAASRICSGKSEIARGYLDNNYVTGHIGSKEIPFEGLVSSARSYSTFSSFSKSYNDLLRSFSSPNYVKSSGEEDCELDDFLLKVSTTSDDGELYSEEEDSDGDDIQNELESLVTPNELESLGTEADKKEKESLDTKCIPSMAKAFLDNHNLSVNKVLNSWVEEGNEVTQAEIAGTISFLRKRKLYLRALQVLEWLESTKHLELDETYYASRVDLIAKVHGLSKAEEYMQKKIPESLQGELVYRNLLFNYVANSNIEKSEELFTKMKRLGFPLSCFTCNSMIVLYKKFDIEKVSDILLLMEKENLKPDAFTYQALLQVYIDNKLLSQGKNLLKQMAESGYRIGPWTWDALVKLYIGVGELEKADSILEKATEQNNMRGLYVSYLCILESYAKRGDVLNAEKIFGKMKQVGYKASHDQYQELLQAYLNAKVLPYGFSDRLKADGVSPSKAMADQLTRANEFVISPVLDVFRKLFA